MFSFVQVLDGWGPRSGSRPRPSASVARTKRNDARVREEDLRHDVEGEEGEDRVTLSRRGLLGRNQGRKGSFSTLGFGCVQHGYRGAGVCAAPLFLSGRSDGRRWR